MRRKRLRAFVVAVDIAAVAACATLPVVDLSGHVATLIALLLLAAVAGTRPVRITAVKAEIAVTHPVVLCALAALGPLAAALTAGAGVLGSGFVRSQRFP